MEKAIDIGKYLETKKADIIDNQFVIQIYREEIGKDKFGELRYNYFIKKHLLSKLSEEEFNKLEGFKLGANNRDQIIISYKDAKDHAKISKTNYIDNIRLNSSGSSESCLIGEFDMYDNFSFEIKPNSEKQTKNDMTTLTSEIYFYCNNCCEVVGDVNENPTCDKCGKEFENEEEVFCTVYNEESTIDGHLCLSCGGLNKKDFMQEIDNQIKKQKNTKKALKQEINKLKRVKEEIENGK